MNQTLENAYEVCPVFCWVAYLVLVVVAFLRMRWKDKLRFQDTVSTSGWGCPSEPAQSAGGILPELQGMYAAYTPTVRHKSI
jgi:hypothetical protein